MTEVGSRVLRVAGSSLMVEGLNIVRALRGKYKYICTKTNRYLNLNDIFHFIIMKDIKIER